MDDGSATRPRVVAAAAGARVIKHPYNKGNGAAVKTGIRQASGEYVLIIDGDGQHSAADAGASGRFLGDYDLVVGARDRIGAGVGGASCRQQPAELARELSHRAADSGSDLGTSGRTHERPARVSSPAAQRVFHADHHDALVREGRIQRPLRADRVVARLGRSKIKLVSDGAKFFLILLKVVTVFSPLRIFLPVAAAAFALGAAYAAGPLTAAPYHQLLGAADPVGRGHLPVGLVSEQISIMRSEGPR